VNAPRMERALATSQDLRRVPVATLRINPARAKKRSKSAGSHLLIAAPAKTYDSDRASVARTS